MRRYTETIGLWIEGAWYKLRPHRSKLQLAAFIILTVAAIYSYHKASNAASTAQQAAQSAQQTADTNTVLATRANKLAQQIEAERTSRTNQACRGLELSHRTEVRDLRRAYAFYKNPPPSFADLLSNPLVLANLREDIQAAKDDQDARGVFVPNYCDDPGVGLKEPDPVLPKQPAVVTKALKATTQP